MTIYSLHYLVTRMKARHYCADCDTHFNASVEQHADTYHESGVFRGMTDGNYSDYWGYQNYRV